MMDWFYYDENGKKNGPYSVSEMKAFAKHGVIKRDTFIENANGKSALAGDIQGFEFPEKQYSHEQPISIESKLYCTNCGNTIDEQVSVCMSCGANPIGHKKFCRQCGVGLNPEQVICIKCRGTIGGTFGTIKIPPSKNNQASPTMVNKNSSALVAGIAIITIVVVLSFILYILSSIPCGDCKGEGRHGPFRCETCNETGMKFPILKRPGR
jgi:DnaJ-class molecular chaperone